MAIRCQLEAEGGLIPLGLWQLSAADLGYM